GFVMLPLTTFEALYGRRQTTVISVKMPAAAGVADGMLRAEEAMRIAHRLRPGQEDDFTVDTGEGLIAFWAKLTRVIFTVVPAVVAIGIVVGGIVIMNIMLMSVTERTREIGILKSLGASRRDIRRQFLAESAMLSLLGGVAGLLGGSALAALVEIASPLPARVTGWSVAVGPTTFRVLRFFSSTPLNPDALPREVRIRPALTPQEAEAIARLPEIHYAAIWTQVFHRFEYAGNRTQVLGVFGADDRYMEILGGGLVAGRVFTTAELRSGAPVAVIEQRTVDRLFGAHDPIGEVVRIGGRPCRAVGVWQL